MLLCYIYINIERERVEKKIIEQLAYYYIVLLKYYRSVGGVF